MIDWSDIVGLAEIAERTDVKRNTIDQWKLRQKLPPGHEVSGRTLWSWSKEIVPVLEAMKVTWKVGA